MKITIESGPGVSFLLRSENGTTRLVQTDREFPLVAKSLGWTGVDEESGDNAWDAYEFLERHLGESIDDPGYF